MPDNPMTLAGDTMAAPLAAARPMRKGIDLAVIRRGARDYLEFLDTTKETFFAFLYHRTGSSAVARTLLADVYTEVLSRAMSLWWFGALTMRTLLDAAERALRSRTAEAADLDQTYLPALPWFTESEKSSVATLHDALWSLPLPAQRLVILSLLLGLPEDRIAEATGLKRETVAEHTGIARELLLARWQPPAEVRAKLASLVFLPSIDVAAETSLRLAIVEKYNALRFRRYQWVVLAGLFAVMSNVIVAGLIIFTVVVAPPTSLRTTRTQVASLDAVLLERRAAAGRLRSAGDQLTTEARRLAAHDAASSLTDVGLSAARSALTERRSEERDLAPILRSLRAASLALLRIGMRIVAFIMQFLAA